MLLGNTDCGEPGRLFPGMLSLDAVNKMRIKRALNMVGPNDASKLKREKRGIYKLGEDGQVYNTTPAGSKMILCTSVCPKKPG